MVRRGQRERLLLVLCVLTCALLVFASTAALCLGNILHVTHNRSILVEPRVPGGPRLIERAWEIVGLPDALVLLRQVVPRKKGALDHRALKHPRIVDE